MEQTPSQAVVEIKEKIAELEKYLTLLKGSIEKYTAVIVEPRKHKALEFVLRNVLDNLDERWSIQVFHSSHNKDWIKTILDQKFQNDLSMLIWLAHSQQFGQLTSRQLVQELAQLHKLLSFLVLIHGMFQLMAPLLPNMQVMKAKVSLVHADEVNQNHRMQSIAWPWNLQSAQK